MRYYFLTIGLLLSTLTKAQEEPEYRVIPSVTDWIEEINNWPDSVYEVSDIKILIDMKKDFLIAEKYIGSNQDSVEQIAKTVRKPVRITRWEIVNDFGTSEIKNLKNIRFLKEVELNEYQGLGTGFQNFVFDKRLRFQNQKRFSLIAFRHSQFKSRVTLTDIDQGTNISFQKSKLDEGLSFFDRTQGEPLLRIVETEIFGSVYFSRGTKIGQLFISNSKINGRLILENAAIQTAVYISNSELEYLNIEGAQLPEKNMYVPFQQITNKITVSGSTEYRDSTNNTPYLAKEPGDFIYKREYDLLIASYKLLLDSYQSRGDQESYNACYVEMRDKQTAYYKYRLNETYSLDNYLVYQLNVFLKMFSAYGTRPTKAIIVSIYVILAFAFVYLFFPNYWDSHGKNRIMDRYRFFTKYMKRDSGMHEVYLEEKNQELMASEDFKSYMIESEKGIPRFFMATALPLYRWSVAGTKTFSWMLSKVDVLKGKWSDTEDSKRGLKTILLISAFMISLTYDIFIKVLNALMLSINTFTTLGFGEIPIKGLPRYLAIIQGFIGWFMLTIFSVSLISQLLN